MLGALLWLFSPAWDAVEFTLEVGSDIFPFMVIECQSRVDPADSGRRDNCCCQAFCLTVFNLSPTQNTSLFTDVNKAGVCVREHLAASCWAHCPNHSLSQIAKSASVSPAPTRPAQACSVTILSLTEAYSGNISSSRILSTKRSKILL